MNKEEKKSLPAWVWVIAIILIILFFYGYVIGIEYRKLKKIKERLDFKVERLESIDDNVGYTSEHTQEFIRIKEIEEEIIVIEQELNDILQGDEYSTWALLTLSALDNAYSWVYSAKLSVSASYLRKKGIEINPKVVDEVLKNWEWEYLKEKY